MENALASEEELESIAEKAREFATLLGIEGFKASTGWLKNFRDRYSIAFKTIQGAEGAIVEGELTDWQRDTLTKELSGYEPKDVFNLDETGVFWKLLPNKTMAFKGDRCSGGKKSKERITILVGANMNETEFLRLFVDGKSLKPRCFKNAKLPCKYTANTKVWMTSDLRGLSKAMG